MVPNPPNLGACRMPSTSFKRFTAYLASSILVACGGGDGGTSVGTVASVTITPPASAVLATLGRTLQLAAQAKDAGNAVIGGASFTWNSATTGTATVSSTGLLTAVGNGTTQIIATSGGVPSLPVTITVAQVIGQITVTSTSATLTDTLFAATRTRQLTATGKDSLGNALPAVPTFTWSSGTTGVATVGAGSGLVTAVADGSASIQASSGGINGTRTVVVRRFAATHSVTPPTANITTAGGTQVYTGTASDSAAQPITGASLSWSSRSTATATVSPATGANTTATAVANGTARIILSVAGVAVDSATVTVSGQPTTPTTATVTVGDDFFRSVRNNTTQPAVDTVAVNGTVTWNWTGTSLHSVQSTGSPSFTSSTTKNTGSYALQFTSVGTYAYNCAVHGNAMMGTIVVK